jgi:hypothetical protein
MSAKVVYATVSYERLKNKPNYKPVARSFNVTHLDQFMASYQEKGYTKPLPTSSLNQTANPTQML